MSTEVKHGPEAGSSQEPETANVETINNPRLNPPSMTASNIESYFLSLEFWFAASGIGNLHDAKKYNIVMAQVPPNKLTELRSIIDATPANDRRLQRVLSDMPLGDMKPSQLFNEMLRVAGNSLGEAVLLDLWASRLPPHAQAAVIASKGDADEKTTIADAIVDSMGLRGLTATTAGIDTLTPKTPSASTNSPEAKNSASIEILQQEISQLSRKFDQMFSRKNLRDRSRSRSRYTSDQRNSHELSYEVCWYHRTFGREARQCRKPCSFRQSSSSQQ
ncbi:uncharacterized protein LOC131679065 [Topomyia yanbarensis]|uniref:uncharacterized protein LOC131679065 n=1 Tax=Topomyia yanbarensis TaxID=2498891 RepID=UPI00273CE6CA|nr:uncharacterized protein LOC131679065 [Topomyia yanbarensis]